MCLFYVNENFSSNESGIRYLKCLAFFREATADELLLVEPSMYTNVQNWAGDLISGNNTSGRFLVIFAFLCSITAFIVYIIGKQVFTTFYTME